MITLDRGEPPTQPFAGLTSMLGRSPAGPAPLLQRNRRGGPAGGILVGLDPPVQIDDHRVAVAPDHVAVHVPGRPSGRVNAVWLVLGIVLRALEAMVFCTHLTALFWWGHESANT